MEIAVVIIVVLTAAVFTIIKLRKMLLGKDSNCACTNCPSARNSGECTGNGETCGYSGEKEPKKSNDAHDESSNG